MNLLHLFILFIFCATKHLSAVFKSLRYNVTPIDVCIEIIYNLRETFIDFKGAKNK